MSAQSRFGSSLFGFNKEDVNEYIENILKEFDSKLREKENEADGLKKAYKEIKAKYDEISEKAQKIEADRKKIADVLIKAEDTAERISIEARDQALADKAEIESLVEAEREKLVDAKMELKSLRDQIAAMLEKFKDQLDEKAE
ncbi:MAG: hypothetical protein PHX37_01990 [Eubacteriales bacterium]|nr:hypothetical protein [Eubacteriales bacterium]